MNILRMSFRIPHRGLADNVEIAAIGDIHGHSDLLDALLETASKEPRRAARREIVFLGDLIDRGPDSLGTIRLALGAAARVHADEAVFLMGNHEVMLKMAVDQTLANDVRLDAFECWRLNGGRAVLDEIGVAGRGTPKAVREALPADCLDWLGRLKPSHRSGDVLFVHAGLHPYVPLDAFLDVRWDEPLFYLEEDLHWAWIRGPFLTHEPGEDGHHGLFVVHGHSPHEQQVHTHEEQIRRSRLNLDGGSYYTRMAKLAIISGQEAVVYTSVSDEE